MGCQTKWIIPFPNKYILDSSKLKEFADDNFTFDENRREFSKGVENTGGKAEIAHHKENKCDKKTEICFWNGGKSCRKRGKCRLLAFSPCTTILLKGFFLKVIKSRDCVVKSYFNLAFPIQTKNIQFICFINCLPQIVAFNHSEKETFVGKGENAAN